MTYKIFDVNPIEWLIFIKVETGEAIVLNRLDSAAGLIWTINYGRDYTGNLEDIRERDIRELSENLNNVHECAKERIKDLILWYMTERDHYE